MITAGEDSSFFGYAFIFIGLISCVITLAVTLIKRVKLDRYFCLAIILSLSSVVLGGWILVKQNIRNDHAEIELNEYMTYLTKLGAFYSEQCSPLVLYGGDNGRGIDNVLSCNGTIITVDSVIYNKALNAYKKTGGNQSGRISN